jgi:hypothetical protein
MPLLILKLCHIFMALKMMQNFVDESMVFLERKSVLLEGHTLYYYKSLWWLIDMWMCL